MTLVTRFAPSPTGLLHKGHAFSALTAWTAAREAGGRFLLRIEDTDFTRCRPEYTEAVFEDLAWLGLEWETPVRRQSEHRAAYDRALDALREQGLLYRCFRTRKERLALAGSRRMPMTRRILQPSPAGPTTRTRRRGGWRPERPLPGGCRWTGPGRNWAICRD